MELAKCPTSDNWLSSPLGLLVELLANSSATICSRLNELGFAWCLQIIKCFTYFAMKTSLALAASPDNHIEINHSNKFISFLSRCMHTQDRSLMPTNLLQPESEIVSVLSLFQSSGVFACKRNINCNANVEFIKG